MPWADGLPWSFVNGFNGRFRAFIEFRWRLIFCDVECVDDFLLAFRGHGQLFLVLERVVELPGQIIALFVALLEVGFALAEPIVHALQRVFDGCNRTGGAVAHIGFVFVPAVDDEGGAFVEAVTPSLSRIIAFDTRRSLRSAAGAP